MKKTIWFKRWRRAPWQIIPRFIAVSWQGRVVNLIGFALIVAIASYFGFYHRNPDLLTDPVVHSRLFFFVMTCWPLLALVYLMIGYKFSRAEYKAGR